MADTSSGSETRDTPTTPANGEGGGSAGGSANEMPAWFRTYQEQQDKRIEGLAAKLREVAPAKPKPAEPLAKGGSESAPPTPGVTQADLEASMRLGELRASLDEAGRAELDELRGEGFSLAQVVAVGERMVKRSANGRATVPANGAPPGIAANAAPSTAQRFPKSMSELRELKAKDAKAYEQLMARPDFDPTLLART